MPVDRFGKLTFRQTPLNPKYNMPINRKPKRHKLDLLWKLPIVVAILLFIIALIVSHVSQPNGTLLNWGGNGNQRSPVVHVHDTWQLEWTCNPTNYMVDITIVDVQEGIVQVVPVVCTPENLSGVAQVAHTGVIYLDVQSRASYVIDIEEP